MIIPVKDKGELPMLYDDLIKLEVLSSDGNIFGKVDGIVLEGKWKVKSLAVKIDSEDTEVLGWKKPFLSALRLDSDVDLIEGLKDKVILDKTMKELGDHLVDHDKENEAERMIGLEVMGTDGKLIGKVIDIQIDIKKWNIPSLIIKVKKDSLKALKMDDGLFSDKKISLPTEQINEVGEDFIMLKLTSEELGDILEISAT